MIRPTIESLRRAGMKIPGILVALVLAYVVCGARVAAFPLPQSDDVESSSPSTDRANLKNVTYCSPGGVAQLLDIYFPTDGSKGPWPVVMYIHGGYWEKYDKTLAPGYLETLAASSLEADGFVFVSIDYRLAPTYMFPAQIEDAKCAVRFLRANASTYNLDPNHVSVMGNSAGGHLAMLVGLAGPSAGWDVGQWLDESSSVIAVSDNWGPADLTRSDWLAQYSHLMTAVFGGTTPAILTPASPVTYITPSAPPFFIVQGNEDKTVPEDQSQEMYNDLIAAGDNNATLQIVLNAGHNLKPVNPNVPIDPSLTAVTQEVVNFYLQYAK